MADHELDCFVSACDLAPDQFSVFNLPTDDLQHLELVGVDGIIIGGSGDFSLVEGGFEWRDDALELARHLVRVGKPTFGACFGLQVIVEALGGTLVRDEERAEVGSFPVELTEAADDDPVFGTLPDRFNVQLGHNDSAVELPDELVHLASSNCCEYQAVKVRDRPVMATQFHPELTRRDSLHRFRNYLESFKPDNHSVEEAMAYARERHQPSPEARSLLSGFVRQVIRRS